MFKSIKYFILLQACILCFTNMCVTTVEGLRRQNGGISIDCAQRIQIGASPCVDMGFMANEFRIPSLSNRFDSESCKAIGQYCSTSDECCTRKCLSARRRCVT